MESLQLIGLNGPFFPSGGGPLSRSFLTEDWEPRKVIRGSGCKGVPIDPRLNIKYRFNHRRL